MKLRLSEKDVSLITFINEYTKIKAADCKKLYQSKDYYRKRLKVLEKAKYIRREKRYYIKLDIEGRKVIKLLGYDSYNICRNRNHQERLNDILKIATMTLDSEISFIPSWNFKENDIYTDYGRKFIGELGINARKYITYFISNRNNEMYARQVIADTEKMIEYDNVIIFIEDFKLINKRNRYFILGKASTQIIKPTEEKLKMFQQLVDIDIAEVIQKIYAKQEIYMSDWDKADYRLENGTYIVTMPFIDTEKLHGLNIAYRDSRESYRKIDILTLKENRDKIDEILRKKTNIIEIDEYIYKIRIENEEFYKMLK